MNILNIPNIFKNKKAKPVIHSDSCMCSRCTGMDVIHNEIREVRMSLRSESIKQAYERQHNRTLNRTTVVDITNLITNKEQLDMLNKQKSMKETHNKAAKYLRALGVME